MQIIFVPSLKLNEFILSGEISSELFVVNVTDSIYLRPVDFPNYMSGILRSHSINHGGLGKMFIWWRDDFEDGECDMEETLVPLNEWMEGGWIHKLDALVIEVFEPHVESNMSLIF